MATTYDILRVEIRKDREGNDEIFVDAQLYDDFEGIINIPRWYQGNMAKQIIADHSKSGNDKDKALHDHIKKTMNAHVSTKKWEREKSEREGKKTEPDLDSI